MITYAVRTGVDKVVLLYPKTLTSLSEPDLSFTVPNELGTYKEIIILMHQIPIIEPSFLDKKFLEANNLREFFEDCRSLLKIKLEDVFDFRS